ncbi:MAG: hypothetical protein KDK45_08320, partial [Leptospiraceae bacterium]|nr:hypothetical protein [Leptospiraceae bacterium]
MKAIQKKEKRLYSLTLNHADSLKAYTRLNDPYGREILVSRQGKIQYLFSSSSYKRLFPEDTHYPFFWEEAEGLYGKKEFGKSLLLLKGLKLCNLLK